ncbi:MAG: hypothetical protein COB78_05680 [Hyphomicrobiales bacterium]|nr:MAG: hypothetical protein COB78_05680 [Hyphomicrobiales bacterium]
MIWDSLSDLLPGLMPAVYRGLDFHMPDTSIEPGRRIAEHLFPGIDIAAYDDTGKAQQIVTCEGLYIGDDYIAKAKMFEKAFERPGPGQLIHPWLGGMRVLIDGTADISFSDRELRVVRFVVSFKKIGFGGGAAYGGSTISKLLFVARSLIAPARGLIRRAEGSTLSRVRFKALQRSNRIIREAFAEVNAFEIVDLANQFLAIPADGLALYDNLSASLDLGFDAVPDWGGTSPVAPAAEAAAITGLAADIAVSQLLDVTASLTANATLAPSPTDKAIIIASCVFPFSAALQLSTIIEHEARDSATALRGRIAETASAIEENLVSLSTTSSVAAASDLLRTVIEAKHAAASDINEAIGRLPAVLRVELETETDAFLVANHYYGDDPALVEEGHASIVSRNRPRNPALLSSGALEVLR